MAAALVVVAAPIQKLWPLKEAPGTLAAEKAYCTLATNHLRRSRVPSWRMNEDKDHHVKHWDNPIVKWQDTMWCQLHPIPHSWSLFDPLMQTSNLHCCEDLTSEGLRGTGEAMGKRVHCLGAGSTHNGENKEACAAAHSMVQSNVSGKVRSLSWPLDAVWEVWQEDDCRGHLHMPCRREGLWYVACGEMEMCLMGCRGFCAVWW